MLVHLESIDGLQVFWLDRMMDFNSFRVVVANRFGSEPEEIFLVDLKVTDPRLIRLWIPPDRVGEFQEFFRPYDVSKRPPIILDQRF